jgi:nucleoside-diphosphate-sugar epimerase
VTPLAPLEVYGESKLAAEALVAAFHADSGIPSTILRLFNAIGRNETNPHVIPHIFESLQSSDTIRLGNIAPCRDYIDTRDIAEAIAAATARPQGLRIFNVGTGSAHSVQDVVGLLERILGRPITIVQDPSRMRPTERMLLAADIQDISSALHWTPRVPLEATLKDLVAAYRLQTQPSSAR